MIKNQRLVEQRRRQIVQGAVDLFVRKGFHKTTTREIARACGLSIGTMYEYIQSKEDVLYLVCDYIHSELESAADRGHPRRGLRPGEPEEGDRPAVPGHGGDVRLRPSDLPGDQIASEEDDEICLKKEEEITGHFERILEKGIRDGTLSLSPSSVKLMAHNIMVMGQMWTFRRWVLARHYTLEEYTRLQTALLLRDLSMGVRIPGRTGPTPLRRTGSDASAEIGKGGEEYGDEHLPTKHTVRFVTAASLFDGHDASINLFRRLLQASGAEVIHLGHNRSVDEIVEAAIQEDVQGIAVSSYQGDIWSFSNI